MQNYPRPSAYTVAFWTILLVIVYLLGLSYRRACSNAGNSLSADEFFKGVLYNSSNCGGNSSALSKCKMVGLSARIEAVDNHGVFDINSLSEVARQGFVKGTQSHWNRTAKFLILRGPTDVLRKDRQVFVICDTAYGNVPQRTFWNLHLQNIAHAVGYADGTTALISPEQFAALDKSGFFELPAATPR